MYVHVLYDIPFIADAIKPQNNILIPGVMLSVSWYSLSQRTGTAKHLQFGYDDIIFVLYSAHRINVENWELIT